MSTDVLTTEEVRRALVRVLPSKYSQCTLIHHSKLGYTNVEFSNAVLSKSGVVVVLRHLVSEAVFGGFVEDTFTQQISQYVEGSPENCVFRLTGKPLKLLASPSEKMRVCPNPVRFGLLLGLGNDLRAFGDHEGSGYCHPFTFTVPAPGFDNPAKLSAQTITGSTLDSGMKASRFNSSDTVAEVFECKAVHKAARFKGNTGAIITRNLTIAFGVLLPHNRHVCTFLHSSTNGSNPADFHRVVSQQGRILTVIRYLQSGFVFGAYVEDTFSGAEWTRGSPANFIYRATGIPMKLTLNANATRGLNLNSRLTGLQMVDLQTFSTDSGGWGWGVYIPRAYTTSAAGFPPLPRSFTSATLTGIEANKAHLSAFRAQEAIAELYQCDDH
eukprot:m.87086 g.87086  ORF g.87086 m.87086 type:complete len:384 (+) comp50956_c0_seq1:652-1803(+)